MRSRPIAHAPSFDPTVYPFQLMLTLSTSTPPSTLSLPRHQYKEEAERHPIRFVEDAERLQNSENAFEKSYPWSVVFACQVVGSITFLKQQYKCRDLADSN